MKLTTIVLAAVVALTVPGIASAQGHAHSGGQRGNGQHSGQRGGGQEGRGHEGHKGSNGRSRDGRRLDRNTHHRLDRDRDIRFIDGYRQVYFEGWWFGCDVWPEWVFTEDVYFEMGPNNVWFAYGYNNPALFVQVVVVD